MSILTILAIVLLVVAAIGAVAALEIWRDVMRKPSDDIGPLQVAPRRPAEAEKLQAAVSAYEGSGPETSLDGLHFEAVPGRSGTAAFAADLPPVADEGPRAKLLQRDADRYGEANQCLCIALEAAITELAALRGNDDPAVVAGRRALTLGRLP